MASPKIGIIMGSASDIPVVEKGTPVLDELGIEYEVAIASAHRTPEDVEGYAKKARAPRHPGAYSGSRPLRRAPRRRSCSDDAPRHRRPRKRRRDRRHGRASLNSSDAPRSTGCVSRPQRREERLSNGGAHSRRDRLRADKKTRSLRRKGIPEGPRQPQKTGKPPRRARRGILNSSKT